MKEWDRRGLEGMPLKLLLAALLLSISLPTVVSTIDDYQTSVGKAAATAEASRLAAAVADVYSSGEGNVRIVTVKLPAGQNVGLEVGGEGHLNMSVRGHMGGAPIAPVYISDPPVIIVSEQGGNLTIGPGSSRLRLECLPADGRLVVMVGVIE